MTDKKSARPVMLAAGLAQGLLLLTLHTWQTSLQAPHAQLSWLIPAHVFVLLGPCALYALRGEFSTRHSLLGALVLTSILAVAGSWIGWTNSADAPLSNRSALSGSGTFISISLIVWFVGLPFVQSGLRHRNVSFPYADLFNDAWRNLLLLLNCLFFTGVFWLLLVLWAGLFSMLGIKLFATIFRSVEFIYIATAMAISYAASLEERGTVTLGSARKHLLGFQKRLLPLASLILVLFVLTLASTGIQSLWNTRYATPLILVLQMAVVTLTNAAWQDGGQATPSTRAIAWLIRVSLLLLPVLSILAAWSLWLRVDQYGWTEDRFWATFITATLGLYALAYAYSATRSGWLPTLGQFNTKLALALIAALLLTCSPLLDPNSIVATNQVQRLLAGRIDAERFDYNLLRFDLGRPGRAALQQLSQLHGHPSAEVVNRQAKAALAKTERYERTKRPDTLSKEEIAKKLHPYPVGATINPSFLDYLEQTYKYSGHDRYGLARDTRHPMLAVDLNDDGTPEYILFTNTRMPSVFSLDANGWQEAGTLELRGKTLKAEELLQLLQSRNYDIRNPEWKELQLGTQTGRVIPRIIQ